MTISLHTQTRPLTPQRRPVYPRWSSQTPQKRNFSEPKQIFIRQSLTASFLPLKQALSRGPVRGSAYQTCQDYLQTTRLVLLTVE